MTGRREGIYHAGRVVPEEDQVAHRIIGVSADGAVIWAPEDRSTGDEIAAIIDRISQERHRRSTRGGIMYPSAGDPALAAEEIVLRRRWTGALRPDEFLDCLGRRGLYVACRKVRTVDLDQARQAGL